jgi:mRNA interferase RelE/StbE
MTYAVILSSAAERQLGKLDRSVVRRIADAMTRLADQPRPPGCKKLTGIDAWRIRVGDFRVVYEIHDDRLLVLVVRIGHRREVYD